MESKQLSAEEIIQFMYENKDQTSREYVAHTDDNDAILIKLGDGYEHADLNNFEISFSVFGSSQDTFIQKGPVPSEELKQFLDKYPEMANGEIEDAVKTAILINAQSKPAQVVDDYINTVMMEDLTEEDFEIDETWVPQPGEVFGDDLSEEIDMQSVESWLEYQESMEEENEIKEEIIEEDEIEEENETIKENKTKEENVPNVDDSATYRDVPEEELETEEETNDEIEEALENARRRIEENKLVEEEQSSTLTEHIAKGLNDENLDKIKIDNMESGDKVEISRANKENPNVLDDSFPGIVVKINGRVVSRKTFEKFIDEHKTDFVRAYNEVYEKEILEREKQILERERKSQGKEQQTKTEEKENTTHEFGMVKNGRKIPTFKDVGSGDYTGGKETLNQIFNSYSDIPWKGVGIKLKNGDEIHAEPEIKPDQQPNPYKRIFMMNGKEMSGRDYAVFARYVDLHKDEIKTKFTKALDMKRAEIADRNKGQEFDR